MQEARLHQPDSKLWSAPCDHCAYMALVCVLSQTKMSRAGPPVVSPKEGGCHSETGSTLLMRHPLCVLTGKVPRGVWAPSPCSSESCEDNTLHSLWPEQAVSSDPCRPSQGRWPEFSRDMGGENEMGIARPRRRPPCQPAVLTPESWWCPVGVPDQASLCPEAPPSMAGNRVSAPCPSCGRGFLFFSAPRLCPRTYFPVKSVTSAALKTDITTLSRTQGSSSLHPLCYRFITIINIISTSPSTHSSWSSLLLIFIIPIIPITVYYSTLWLLICNSEGTRSWGSVRLYHMVLFSRGAS